MPINDDPIWSFGLIGCILMVYETVLHASGQGWVADLQGGGDGCRGCWPDDMHQRLTDPDGFSRHLVVTVSSSSKYRGS